MQMIFSNLDWCTHGACLCAGLQDVPGLCVSAGEPEGAGSPAIPVPYPGRAAARVPQRVCPQLLLQGTFNVGGKLRVMIQYNAMGPTNSTFWFSALAFEVILKCF